MSNKININKIVSIIEEVTNVIKDNTLKVKLSDIKNHCEQSKIIKWKSNDNELQKRKHKLFLHVFYGVYKEGVIAFYVNSRRNAKAFNATVNSGIDKSVEFKPVLSITIGNNKNNNLIRELKSLHYLYKYKNTKNKFRFVFMENLKSCVECIAKICENKNHKIVYNDIHNL
nr:ORF30 [Darna trima granulovirus]